MDGRTKQGVESRSTQLIIIFTFLSRGLEIKRFCLSDCLSIGPSIGLSRLC